MKKYKPENSNKNREPVRLKQGFTFIKPLIIFFFSFLLYSQSINFKYTMFDDDSLLIKNKEFFTTDRDLKTIFTTDAFLTTEGTFYRPLQNISFLIDAKVFGIMDVRMFHFTNVFLFALIALSLYFLLLKFNISHLIAFFGTLVYAAHPLFVSSATWIPARGDLLLTLFAILSFIFWIKFINKKKYSTLIISWLFFTLALFTKETAALLPVLFFIYFLVFESKPKLDYKIVLFGFLVLCSGVLWFVVRTLYIKTFDSDLTVSMFLQNLFAIPAGLAMFAVPYDFSTAPEFTHIKIILGFILFMLLIIMILKKSSQSRWKKLFYLFWFIFLLFPTFFARTKEWDYLDHRFLLPLIGIFIFILSLIEKFNNKRVAVFSTILIIIFSTVSVFKSKAFSNPVSFCEAMRFNKNKPEIYYFLKGNLEQISEKYDKALMQYDKAIAYNPNYIKALNNRGIVKQTLGDISGALEDYNQAIALGVNNYHIFKNRGNIRLQLGDYNGAVEDYNSALEMEHHAELYFNKAVAKYILLDYDGALEECEILLSIDSLYPNAKKLKIEILQNK